MAPRSELAALRFSVLLAAFAARAAADEPMPMFSDSRALAESAPADLLRDSAPALDAGQPNQFIAVWEVRGPNAASFGKDRDLLYSRSTDAGNLWTAPAPVNADAAADSAMDAMPSVAGDPHGNWVIAWAAETTGTLSGSPIPDFDIHFVYSADGGSSWTVRAPLHAGMTGDGGDDFTPKLRAPFEGSGPWMAVWESRGALAGSVGTDPDILYSRSLDSGRSWTEPAPLDPAAETDSRTDQAPDLAEGAGGVWIACWHSRNTPGEPDDDSPELRLARSSDHGQTWDLLEGMPPVGILMPNEHPVDWEPRIIFAGGGEWHLAWRRQIFAATSSSGAGEFGPARPFVSRSMDDGVTWTAAAPLDLSLVPLPGAGYDVRLESDREGTTLAVWAADPAAGSGATDADLFLARWNPAASAWGPPAWLNATMRSDSVTDAAPSVAFDAEGYWVAAWEGFGGPGGIYADGDIFTARLFLTAPRNGTSPWWIFYD